MNEPSIHRSQRFTNAARTERDRLERKRAKLAEKREAQQRKVDELDRELEAVGDEIQRLDGLAEPFPGSYSLSLQLHKSPESEGQKLLKGAQIRELAVPLALAKHEMLLHYRDWFELLQKEGYEVAGQRPDAVFLNQVVRSPLVRATTKAGYYEIDPRSVDRLRERLQEQRAELAEFMRQAPAAGGEAFDKHREQQHAMNTATARTERELKEAEKAIEAANEAPADLRAA